MTEEQAKRKLTAILSADVKGYSRLMEDDEEATVRTINAYREMMVAQIRGQNGRVVDAKGDNVLAEFASVVDAVRCAVQIQKELGKRNDELPENRRMEFRIGINLGDVIEEKETIYGDGVNIAARLEALADGGGVCISGTAFDQIAKKLPIGYEYLGEQTVKNIEKPVRAYKVLMEPEYAGKVIGKERPKPKHWRWAVIGGVVVLVVVVAALAIWTSYFRPAFEPASEDRMAFPLPEKPSIAVLPFDNMSGDPEQDYIADGFTENIITGLSQIPEMFVIARNSTFAYKGKAVKVQQVAEDLGVRYVLEGSVARSGDRVRVTAQLIDALKGHHLWAERYDRELKDIFALQDDLAIKILKGMQLKLTQGEGILHLEAPKNFEVYLKLMKGIHYAKQYNIDDNNRARLIAEECIALEPDYGFGYGLLGAVHMADYWLGSTKNPGQSLEKAIEYSQKGLDLLKDKGRGLAFLGYLYSMKRNYDKAIELGEQAISLIPNGADAHAWLALSLNSAGRAQEALPLFEKAMRLNPLPPPFYYLNFGNTYRLLGRFEEAVMMYKKTIARSPKNIFAYIGLAGTYGMLGKEEEAKAAVAEVLRIKPKFSIEYFAKTHISEDKERVIEALRKAGLPEHPPLPLPDKPSIAVLPFDNMSGDPEQEYFSDGITEEIITALSKTPKLFVIARNSTFTYKGKPVKVQQVGRELGVKYVLEGSVRKSEDRVRITAQLVDASTGNHLWAERYDREMKDIFAIQDEITMKILTLLRVRLTEGEMSRTQASGTNNLDAYLLFLQGQEEARRMNKDGNFLSRQFARQAIALDSKYAMAYNLLANSYVNEIVLGLSNDPRLSLKKAMELTQKAIALDNSLALPHALLGWIYTLMRQHDKGIAECEQALNLEPNSALAHFRYSLALRYAGRPKEAITMCKEAIRLDPIPVSLYYQSLTNAYCLTGEYEEAIAAGKKATSLGPNNLVAHAFLAAAYSLHGREEEARVEAAEVLRINPKFSVEYWAKTMPYKNEADKELTVGALRKAGLK